LFSRATDTSVSGKKARGQIDDDGVMRDAIKDRRNSGFRSTYFRIRVSGSKVVISGEIREPKSAYNWLNIADMKAISTQKQHEYGNSEFPNEIRAPGRIRAPTEWVEIWV